jgi:hypothetical protein
MVSICAADFVMVAIPWTIPQWHNVVTIKPRRWRGEALKEVFPSSQKKQTPRAGLITRLDSAAIRIVYRKTPIPLMRK